MIATFHDDETRKVWEGEFSRKLPNQIQAVARRRVEICDYH
jgi:toxin HigB-1